MSYANNAAIPRTPPRPTRFQSSPAASSSACSAIAPIPFPSLDAAASAGDSCSPENAAAAAALNELLMLQKSMLTPESSAEDSYDLTLLFPAAASAPPRAPPASPPRAPPPAPPYAPPHSSAFAGFLPTAPAFSAAALAFGDKMAFAAAASGAAAAGDAPSSARVAQLVSAAEQVASCRKNKTVAAVLAGTDISPDEFAAFYRENGYARRADMPILLFDLNSTLVFRPKAHESVGPKGNVRLSGRREILVRPHIHLLRVLLERYRIGVFTSAESHNASAICAAVESKIGSAIFDRNLIFSRKDTQVYTAEERAALGLDSFKRKKVLGDLFAPEHLGKVILVDDHPERAVLTGARAIAISSWYNDAPNDGALLELVSALMAPAHEPAYAPTHSPRGARPHHYRVGSGGGAYPVTPPRIVRPRWD